MRIFPPVSSYLENRDNKHGPYHPPSDAIIAIRVIYQTDTTSGESDQTSKYDDGIAESSSGLECRKG